MEKHDYLPLWYSLLRDDCGELGFGRLIPLEFRVIRDVCLTIPASEKRCYSKATSVRDYLPRLLIKAPGGSTLYNHNPSSDIWISLYLWFYLTRVESLVAAEAGRVHGEQRIVAECGHSRFGCDSESDYLPLLQSFVYSLATNVRMTYHTEVGEYARYATKA